MQLNQFVIKFLFSLPLKQNALVLLDLIGTSDPQPTFYNTFKETDDLFQRLEQIGKTVIESHLNCL